MLLKGTGAVIAGVADPSLDMQEHFTDALYPERGGPQFFCSNPSSWTGS